MRWSASSPRLARSPHASDFVLKGGVLLAAFAARRPTRDIDFQAAGFPSDVDEVISRARDIAGIEREDGIVFDLDSIRGTTIRDEHHYTGVRATLTCSLFSAKITFHLDVSFGDPIWPEPTVTSLPLLLGGNLPIRGYPIHMVLAEKKSPRPSVAVPPTPDGAASSTSQQSLKGTRSQEQSSR